MKIDYECKYNQKEVEEMVAKEHTAKYVLPDGMVWKAEFESWSGVKLTAVTMEELKESKEEAA